MISVLEVHEVIFDIICFQKKTINKLYWSICTSSELLQKNYCGN